jgi:hypothetical protein
MAGVPSLLGQQQMPGQGPMPGQAQQQPMQGMMPQQGGPSQGIGPNPFKNQKLDELLYLYRNPQLIPEGQTYRVITALSEAVKAENLKKAGQDQQAMAQNAQMQQQPPVAEGLAQQAQALMQQPVMAAYGGEMQGYAGGGAVAFRYGGDVQKFSNGADEFGVLANPEAEAMDALRVERAQKENALRVEREQKEKQLKALEETYYSLMMQNDPRAAQVKQQLDALSGRALMSPSTAASALTRQGKSGIADLDIGPSMAPKPDRAVVRNLGAGQRTQTLAQPKEPVTEPGLPGLMGPQIDPDRLMARQGQQTIADALKRGAQPTEAEIQARGGIDALMKEIVDSRRAEEQRLASQGEQRFREAQERYNKPFLQDPMALGELISGMRGAKTFYEGITGAASAGGKAQGAREQALRQAEDKMDLSRRDVYNLSTLRQQVQLDQAKLMEARASGDAQRENNAAIKLGESQQKLAEFEAGMSDKAAGRRLQEEGIKVQREQITSSEDIARLNRQAQAALRNLPSLDQLRIDRAIESLMAANPGMPFHEAFNKVSGAGRGVEERAELANAKQRAAIIQNELKVRMESDMQGKSPRVQQLQRELDSIYRELGGGAPAASAGGGTVDRNNPLLK